MKKISAPMLRELMSSAPQVLIDAAKTLSANRRIRAGRKGSPVYFPNRPEVLLLDYGGVMSSNGKRWKASNGRVTISGRVGNGDFAKRVRQMIVSEIILDECCEAPFEDFVARVASVG